MVNIKGTKILFIGIGFYDYESNIKTVLESHGAQVNYVCSVVNTLASRIAKRIGLAKLSGKIQNKKRFRILSKAPKNNDIVFAIKGEQLNKVDLELIKKNNPNAEFKLYLWDSVIRHNNLDILHKYFNKVWSFDRIDCQRDNRLQFRPLFYREEPKLQEKLYELSFIGWMHSDRLEIVRELRTQLHKQNKPYYIKLYIAPFSYIMQRYIKRTLTKDDKDLISTVRIPYSEFQRVTNSSKIILDIAHPLQSGLTMRTIEALAAGCHILTSNQDLTNYKSITPEQYTLFTRTNPIIAPQIPEQEIPQMSEYSLLQFLKNILNP